MALVVGTNSWVTLVEADAYFADHPKSSPWDVLDDPTKEQYLILSFNWIVNDPAFTAVPSTVDQNVKNGQCEGALFLINYYDDYTKRDALIATGVQSFTYSKWSETLGEVSKPQWVVYFFDGAGFFNGGGASGFIVSDTNNLI